jgi:hypothetical protein
MIWRRSRISKIEAEELRSRESCYCTTERGAATTTKRLEIIERLLVFEEAINGKINGQS